MKYKDIVKLAKVEATHYEYHGDDFICFYVIEDGSVKYQCVNDDPWENWEDRSFSQQFYDDLKVIKKF